MRSKGNRVVAVQDLVVNKFVRKELNQDHALILAGLIEEGVEMKDMIEVTDFDGTMNVVVDGRHRKEGFELAGVKEVKVRVVEFDSEIEMISYAYKANTGGSLPPTQGDTEHTIMLLLDKGEARKRIGELLGLPAGLARKYIAQVQSKQDRQKVQRAAVAVREGGMTPVKAAEAHGVELDKLKVALGGHKRESKNGIAEAHRNLTKLYRSSSSKNAALLRGLIEKLDDGDVTPKQVRDVFTHIKDLQKASARSVADWEKRFSALVGK